MTVGIVTWNNADTITAAIVSVLAQQDISAEIRVWDNASSDDTVQAVRGLSCVQVTAGDQNLGFARAMNNLLENVSCEYVMLLNPDAELVGDRFLVDAIERLNTLPDAGTVGPRTEYVSGGLQPSAFALPTLMNEMFESLYIYRLIPRNARGKLLLGGHWNHSESRPVGWLLGACLVVPAEVWRAAGGLTEDFHMFSEDLDWGYRVRELGRKCWFVENIHLRHHSNHSGATRWGENRSVVSVTAYYDFLGRRFGRRREVASLLLNGIGFTLRLAIYSVRASAGREGAADWKREYRGLARLHFRRLLGKSSAA